MNSSYMELNSEGKQTRFATEKDRWVHECEESLDTITRHKEDLVALRSRLSTLPDVLKHDVMVPLSSVAFVPGQIVKTNEVFVFIGDGYFLNRSAKQACAIADRRLKRYEEEIEKLKKEVQRRRDWQVKTAELYREKTEVFTLEEHVTEEEFQRSKEERRKRMEEAKRARPKEEPLDHASCMARLEELERLEEEENETDKEYSGDDGENLLVIDESSDSATDATDEEEEPGFLYYPRDEKADATELPDSSTIETGQRIGVKHLEADNLLDGLSKRFQISEDKKIKGLEKEEELFNVEFRIDHEDPHLVERNLNVESDQAKVSNSAYLNLAPELMNGAPQFEVQLKSATFQASTSENSHLLKEENLEEGSVEHRHRKPAKKSVRWSSELNEVNLISTSDVSVQPQVRSFTPSVVPFEKPVQSNVISSPSDIYKLFEDRPHTSMKARGQDRTLELEHALETSEDVDLEARMEVEDLAEQILSSENTTGMAVSEHVIERSGQELEKQEIASSSQRRVSKFKQSRTKI